jgi:rRNA maturation RNase YbeY
MAEINKIKFFYYAVDFSFDHRNRVKRFLLFLFKTERKNLLKLNFIFCSDKYLQQLNKKFLGHNYKTDILTFPDSNQSMPTDAEIYISVKRAKVNSMHYETSFKQELLRLIFHGALHLCGYKDDTQAQIKKMRNREDHYLKLYKSFT